MKWFLVLFVAFLFSEVNGQILQTVNGVHTISYDLEKGSVYIYLPEKIVNEKAFSGTVAIFPKGKTSREQAKNLEQLNKFSVVVLNKEFLLGTKSLSLVGSSQMADISLLDSSGKNLGNMQLKFDIKPFLSPETPLSFPGHIANEINTSVYGVFDGNTANTSVKANGKALKVVAESPVQLCLRPENLTSTTSKLDITDGSKSYQGQCNSIYYTLKIGPTNLKRGQSTFFDATIHGVGTIEESLSYTVANGTPNIVRLEGGNTQSFVINPGDGENGNWFHHFNIKSISTGNFSLTTNLVIPDTPYPGVSSNNVAIISPDALPLSQSNIDCRLYNQSFAVTAEECAQLGGSIYDGTYTSTLNDGVEEIEICDAAVTITQDSNDAQIDLTIQNGDLPEMVVVTIIPNNSNIEDAVLFLNQQQQSYSIAYRNETFGMPSSASVEATLLFSSGNAQTINSQINFSGNPFFSIAKSEELTKIRGEQNKIKNDIKNANARKDVLRGEMKTTSGKHINAREKFRSNNSAYKYLWQIDQSLEKARPAFADSLKVLIDSLKAFKKRTGGVVSNTAAQKIEDNLRDAKKAHQDCLDQLLGLQQEQKKLTNEMASLKEQQKQIHRDIMNHFRSTGMDFAGSTRRDKNGKFHYQYGVVTASSKGKAIFQKGSLPIQIFGKVSALDKQMKVVTDKLNAINERLNNLPGELSAKNDACNILAQKVKDAEMAKSKNDAISAKNQYWNNKIDEICAKIQALLKLLKNWAKINDPNLLNQINNVQCGENIWAQINSVIERKKGLEKEFDKKVVEARRDMNNASAKETELDAKIKEEEKKIRIAQRALVANQQVEAKAAAIALAKDQQKCIGIMNELGYGGTSVTDVIDLYEISQDLKNAADEAQAAMDNLRKAVEYGEKYGMSSGDSKKWIKDAQDRLGNISKKLAKLAEYEDLAKELQELANSIETLFSSDGSPTENAEAFGEGLKLINKTLGALAKNFPILKVFTAYFTFITDSYFAIMKGANSALKKQYQMLLSDVRSNLSCDTLLDVCRSKGDDLAKIKEWAYDKYVVERNYNLLRKDQTQAKKIISTLIEQRMAECCFERLQAIRAAQ